MAERLPKLIYCADGKQPATITLAFDAELTPEQIRELASLVSLQFAGQLRRDPKATMTAPAEPSDG